MSCKCFCINIILIGIYIYILYSNGYWVVFIKVVNGEVLFIVVWSYIIIGIIGEGFYYFFLYLLGF